jgi:hypothetical protein
MTKRCQPEGFEALADIAAPEGERSMKGQFTIKRQTVVGECQWCRMNSAAVRLEEAGCEPDQAGFPAAVWSGDLQCFTRRECKIEPLEQQLAPASQADILEAQQRAHSGSSSSACMSSSEKPK